MEDLTTDGGNKLKFAEAIRRAGAEVTDTFAVFYYDIFTDTPKWLEAAGIRLHYLCTWRDILAVTRRDRVFDDATLGEVERFLAASLEWSAHHGGIATLDEKKG